MDARYALVVAIDDEKSKLPLLYVSDECRALVRVSPDQSHWRDRKDGLGEEAADRLRADDGRLGRHDQDSVFAEQRHEAHNVRRLPRPNRLPRSIW